jgi:cell division septation protein DedD
MEVEGDSNKVVVEEEGDNNVVVPAPSFQVNLDIIESVQIENQSEELRALGLTVYDQSKFEEGILKQVDDALEEQEKLKSLKKKSSIAGKKNKNQQIVCDVVPNKVHSETEREKLVRLGQMTPFGTMLTGNNISQELTSFEKYLLEQEKLRNLKSQHTSKKGKSLKNPGTSKEKVVHVLEPTSPTKKKKKSKQFPDASSSRKRKSSKDDDEWNSDDSDWEYSDEETPSKKKKKKKVRNDKVIDDGNMDDYELRLRDWELDEDIECEEFEGGLKIPSMIWDKVSDFQLMLLYYLKKVFFFLSVVQLSESRNTMDVRASASALRRHSG